MSDVGREHWTKAYHSRDSRLAGMELLVHKPCRVVDVRLLPSRGIAVVHLMGSGELPGMKCQHRVRLRVSHRKGARQFKIEIAADSDSLCSFFSWLNLHGFFLLDIPLLNTKSKSDRFRVGWIDDHISRRLYLPRLYPKTLARQLKRFCEWSVQLSTC